MSMVKQKEHIPDDFTWSTPTQCGRVTLFQDINYEHLDLGHKCLCCDICAKRVRGR